MKRWHTLIRWLWPLMLAVVGIASGQVGSRLTIVFALTVVISLLAYVDGHLSATSRPQRAKGRF